MFEEKQIKGIVHPKIKIDIVYSTSCCSKTGCCYF